MPDKWNFKDGCTACSEDRISLDSLKVCSLCLAALKASYRSLKILPGVLPFELFLKIKKLKNNFTLV